MIKLPKATPSYARETSALLLPGLTEHAGQNLGVNGASLCSCGILICIRFIMAELQKKLC